MKEVTTIGVDLANNVFQVHGVDAEGSAVICWPLRRGRVLSFFKQQPCLAGLEACAASHHWARQVIELGHEVKLMPLARAGLEGLANPFLSLHQEIALA